MPLFYNINTLMYRPCPNCLSFLLQTFPSPTDSNFRDRQLFFDSQLKACFDEVDRARLQLALQQFAKENNSSQGRRQDFQKGGFCPKYRISTAGVWGRVHV